MSEYRSELQWFTVDKSGRQYSSRKWFPVDQSINDARDDRPLVTLIQGLYRQMILSTTRAPYSDPLLY
jgi:hypothetical protein